MGPKPDALKIPEACPICGGAGLCESLALSDLVTARCPGCGHVVALHASAGGGGADYHEQYDTGAYLDALRETRRRQAPLVIGAIRRHVPAPTRLLDYGAGRGWFLEECRRQGIHPLAGADTSSLAVAGLRRAGFEAHLLRGKDGPGGTLERELSFRPRVVTLLDVVEHFPPESLTERLRALLAECGEEIDVVVVKVPIRGLLYRSARLLSVLGADGPLRQLYQAGTWPPHFHCFSPRSMETLLDRLGLALIERIGDPDFEAARLAERAGLPHPAARPFLHLAAVGLVGAVRISGLFDTGIFLARPVKNV